eukprot:4453066-Pyramimonas_sp.AAC.3
MERTLFCFWKVRERTGAFLRLTLRIMSTALYSPVQWTVGSMIIQTARFGDRLSTVRYHPLRAGSAENDVDEREGTCALDRETAGRIEGRYPPSPLPPVS